MPGVATLRGFKVQSAPNVKGLGIALAAGTGRQSSVLKDQLRAFWHRNQRMQWLIRFGISTATSLPTGGLSAVTYGGRLSGPGSGGQHIVCGHTMAGDSVKGTADPAFPAHKLPIGHKAMGTLNRWQPIPDMETLVAKAKVKLAAAARIWQHVHGPGLAAVSSCVRLSWYMTDAATVGTDKGRTLHLNSPAVVNGEVRAAVRRW